MRYSQAKPFAGIGTAALRLNRHVCGECSITCRSRVLLLGK
jgi:hypothetical protein